jgi:hypothetical protein
MEYLAYELAMVFLKLDESIEEMREGALQGTDFCRTLIKKRVGKTLKK